MGLIPEFKRAGAALLAARAETEEGDQMQPMADRVFVRIEQTKAQQTASGIVLPETRDDVVFDGYVIAVGPEVEVLQVGDRVLKVRVLGTDVGARAGVVERHPELRDVHILREHEVTAAAGPGLRERMAAAKERGVSVSDRGRGRW